jgi:type III restriction enzyme
VLYEWLVEDKAPTGIPPVKIEGFKNNGRQNTIRVDSKVVHESDSGESKNDEVRWMRLGGVFHRLSWSPDGYRLK